MFNEVDKKPLPAAAIGTTIGVEIVEKTWYSRNGEGAGQADVVEMERD